MSDGERIKRLEDSLRKLLGYLKLSTESSGPVHAVLISPAARLRAQAEETEQRDRDIIEAGDLLK